MLADSSGGLTRFYCHPIRIHQTGVPSSSFELLLRQCTGHFKTLAPDKNRSSKSYFSSTNSIRLLLKNGKVAATGKKISDFPRDKKHRSIIKNIITDLVRVHEN